MLSLNEKQIAAVNTSFDLSPTKHEQREDVRQLGWQYLLARSCVDWDSPKSIRSYARNCILDATIQFAKRHQMDKRLVLASLEWQTLEPTAPDTTRIEPEQWNEAAILLARVHSIPRPGEDDLSRSRSQMLLRIRAVKMARKTRKTYGKLHAARIRRAAVKMATENGKMPILHAAIIAARMAKMKEQKAEREQREQRETNRANFRLNRMLRETMEALPNCE
jgi:hypothetical protein